MNAPSEGRSRGIAQILDPGLLRSIGILVLVSAASCALLGLRIVLTTRWRQVYLVWNLVLAWLPLFLAVLAVWLQSERPERRWSLRAVIVAWLLFFPNAPYIFTDLVHLGSKVSAYFWADLVLIVLFAFIGMVLGFISLFVMQRAVARRLGWIAGWIFCGGVTTLAGIGIYLGRFLRWNSWDVLHRPLEMVTETSDWIERMPHHPHAWMLPLLFGALLFLAYMMLYSLTQLRPAHLVSSSSSELTS